MAAAAAGREAMTVLLAKAGASVHTRDAVDEDAVTKAQSAGLLHGCHADAEIREAS